jgi:4-hydroxybenzoate polyprenyltransferase
VLKRLKIMLEMIKVEHTMFALPFAFLGAFFAARGIPRAAQIGWILLAMISARSAAMAFNRLVDLPFDAINPRTVTRALPTKLLSRGSVVLFIVVSAGVFIYAATMLNPLAFKLSPVALGIVLSYSYTKRFTWWTHMFLGLSLGCAPIGAWIAIRGNLSAVPLLLGSAVVLWVAGFDIIYSCQDFEFDTKQPLYSIPKRFGIGGALWISAGGHCRAAAGLRTQPGQAVGPQPSQCGVFHGQRLGQCAVVFNYRSRHYSAFGNLALCHRKSANSWSKRTSSTASSWSRR